MWQQLQLLQSLQTDCSLCSQESWLAALPLEHFTPCFLRSVDAVLTCPMLYALLASTEDGYSLHAGTFDQVC